MLIMADQTVTLRITANTQGLVTGVELAKRETRSLGEEGQDAGRKLGGGIAAARSEIERTGTLINQVKGFVGGLAAAFVSFQSVKALASMADEWSDLTSLVKVNIGATEDANAVMERLTQVARGTYSSLRDTAQSFAANATTLNALGKSTQEQLEYTAALNNALVISGAKGEQFAQVQDALSKAMATGALRGEELNTVLGRGSAVAEALAAELGTSALELRQLGADGKITGDVIFTALVRRMGELEERAESMPATIGDAFTVFRNALLSTVGYADNAAGATNDIAEAIIDLADVISRPEVKEGFAAVAIGAVNAAAEVAKLFGEVKKVADFAGRLAGMKLTGWLDPDDLELGRAKFRELSDELTKLQNGERSWSAVTEKQRQARIAYLKEEIAKIQENAKAAIIYQGQVAAAAEDAESAAKKAAEEAERQRQASLDALRAIVTGSGDAEDATRGLADAQADLYTHLTKVTDATDDVDAMLRSLAYGLADEATRALMDYENVQARILELEMAWLDLGPMSEAQIAKLAELRRLAAEGHARNMADLNDGTVRDAQRAAQESARAWQDFTGSLADAVLDGSSGVKRWWKQMLDEMKRQLIQSGLLRLFGSLFNTGGGAGGFASMFGGMLGGGQAGGGFLGQLGNMFSGPAMSAAGSSFGAGFLQAAPWLAAAGGALSGYNRSGIGAAVGYGVLGYAGASVGGMALLAGGTAAAAGGTAAAVGTATMSGAMAGAAAVPVVGWIIAAIAAIDMITGGKVFGTKYRPESSTSTIGIGEEGATAGATLTQVRNRSLFRGRKWETHDIDAGDEAREAAQAFYDGIYDAMVGAARALAIDVPPMIDAAIRTVTEYDKKGKVKGIKVFTDVLGRTWEEAISDPTDEAEVQAAAQRAASRINSEAIIAVIDAALGTTVQQAIDRFGGGGGGGGGGGRRPREGDDFQIVEGGGGLGGAFDAMTVTLGEASAIAERWRDNVEMLAEGAQFLLAAAADIRAGVGLLGEDGSLTQITNLIEELAVSGETLSQTYTRVATSAALWDQALAISGVAIDKTREEMVRFAVDITDAAGGLEQAKALWDSYFANFYSEAERAAYQRGQLRTAADAAFAGAGLDITQYLDTGGLERFRTDFEAAMPTLSAEDVANWLRAADALAAVTASARAIDAQIADGAWQQYLDGLTESERAIAEVTKYYDDWRDSLIAAGATSAQLTAVEEQRAEAMGRLLAAQAEAQAQAEADYQRAVRDIADELAEAGMSEFAKQMRDIGRWTTDTTASLNAAARAAGMQAAREEDLALVHQVAAQRAAAAIAQLRAAAASLVTELFGPAAGSLDDINAQIAALEGIGGQISAGADGAGAAIDNLFQRWMSGVESVQQYLDSMLLGDLSALTPEEQLNEARRQLEATQAAALGGDAEALARLPQLSDAYLRLVRGYEASGQDYNDQFDWVRSLLQSVVDLPNPGTAPGTPGGGGGGNYAPPTSRELEELYAQRDALLAEQEAAHRMALMEQLGGMIRELIQATGEPLADVAASIGLNLTDLASGLGINLNDMSATTASALVDMARMLGVDVAELAQNVGVSLGDLADRQSLLNQALDATLLDVPEDIRAQLEAPLEAVRNATTEADANAALAQLEDVTGDLPTGIRDLLAPYFDFLDPTPMTTELTRLSDIYDTAAAQLDAALATNDLLDRIAANLNASNTAAGLPAFASGGWVNGPTALLAGERGRELILPNPVSEFFQRAGIPINSGGGGDNREVVAELRALRAEVDALRKSQERSAQSVVGAVVKTGEVSDRANDQSRARHARERRGVTP